MENVGVNFMKKVIVLIVIGVMSFSSFADTKQEICGKVERNVHGEYSLLDYDPGDGYSNEKLITYPMEFLNPGIIRELEVNDDINKCFKGYIVERMNGKVFTVTDRTK